MNISKIPSHALNPELNIKAARAFESAAMTGKEVDYDKYLKAVNFYRQAGLISDAIRCLERLQQANIDSEYVQYLHSVLSINHMPKLDHSIDFSPRSFCVIENVLSTDLLNQLLERTYELIPYSHASTIFKGHKPEVRNSLTIKETYFSEFASRYKEILIELLPKFILDYNFDDYSLKSNRKIELQMNVYSDGCFYLPHIDVHKEVKRKYTCVYYYYREPRGFSGGDLILFDKPESSSNRMISYTCLNVKNNSLLIFESDAWHQVTPVKMKSPSSENSRFSLTSWLHENQL